MYPPYMLDTPWTHSPVIQLTPEMTIILHFILVILLHFFIVLSILYIRLPRWCSGKKKTLLLMQEAQKMQVWALHQEDPLE